MKIRSRPASAFSKATKAKDRPLLSCRFGCLCMGDLALRAVDALNSGPDKGVDLATDRWVSECLNFTELFAIRGAAHAHPEHRLPSAPSPPRLFWKRCPYWPRARQQRNNYGAETQSVTRVEAGRDRGPASPADCWFKLCLGLDGRGAESQKTTKSQKTPLKATKAQKPGRRKTAPEKRINLMAEAMILD